MTQDQDIDEALDKSASWRLDIEARNLRRHNEGLITQLFEEGQFQHQPNRSPSELLLKNYVVIEQPAESYFLRRSSFGFLTKEMLDQWEEIGCEVAEVHNRVAGMQRMQAAQALSGDPDVEAIRGRLRGWADKAVSQRLEKTAFKKGGARKQFECVYRELVPELKKMTFRDGTINPTFYRQFSEYLTWKIYEGTLKPFVTYKFDRQEFTTECRVDTEDEVLAECICSMNEVQRWTSAEDAINILSIAAGALSEKQRSYTVDAVRNRLSILAADIEEMRPFLRDNFSSEKVVLEVSPGLFVSFIWATGFGMAIIPAERSAKTIMEGLENNRGNVFLTLSFNGTLMSYITPWIDADQAVLSEPFALHANLAIVEALHSRLYSFYEKVDIDAILSRFRARPKVNSEIEEPTDEEFAALCQTIAEPIKTVESAGLPSSSLIKAVRAQRLFAVLADRLGCEVRQGKGSEIVIFREGGHHFRLGRHKRNNYVPTAVIKNILKHVGVSFTEWLGAIE